MISVSRDARKILKNLPKDGSMIGNVAIRRWLKLSSKRFFEAKTELKKANLIVSGRGKGGSLGLTDPEGADTQPDPKNTVAKENDLYEPLKKYFDEDWSGDYDEQKSDLFLSKITATPKGHKRKGGTWSRPDLVILTVVKDADRKEPPPDECDSFLQQVN